MSEQLDINRILLLRGQGLSYKKLSERFNVSLRYIRRVCELYTYSPTASDREKSSRELERDDNVSVESPAVEAV